MSLVVVAFDGSQSGERAVLRAADLARERDAEVVVLHVLPTTFVREKVAQIDPSSDEDETVFAQSVLDRALTLLAERGVRAQAKLLHGAPAQALLEEIGRLHPSAVVMGTRGMHDLLPEGSVSRRVRSGAGDGVEVVVVD